MTLKDNIETAGPMRTTAGAAVLADHVASKDAAVVARLRDAGAVIIGKANLSELAGAVVRTPGMSAVGGQTRNPYGAFSTGGSSSGSAVAVAAGLCVASLGTETSGSLIAPASFNGVVGMKPSRGLVPTDGIVPLVRAQDSAGPVARCVADAAVLLTVLAGGAFRSPDLSDDALVGVRAGILRADILGQRTPYEDTADNDVVLDRIIAGLEAAGAEPQDTAVVAPEAMKKLEAEFTKYVMGGLAHDTMGYLAAAGAPVSTVAELLAFNLQEPKVRMPKGQFLLALACLIAPDAATYQQEADAIPLAAAALLDTTFEASGGDLLVSITNRHSSLYASAGYPAVTVPIGVRANGMPTGVTLIGRHGDDARLLAWGYAFEQATHLRAQPHLASG
jgi:amidase